MNAWFLAYLLVFLAALALSTILCGLARQAGLALGWMDKPGGRKAHARPIAVTGGYGIFATFAILIGGGLLAAAPLARTLPASLGDLSPWLNNLSGVRGQALGLLAGAAIVFIAGAIDDRRPLGPWVKLAAEALAAVPALAVGITIHAHLPAPVGWLLTVFWILLLTNSFNLLDNMDGLSASVAAVIAGVLALAARLGGQLWMPALFLCFSGTLCGFLVYNWHPARMFMGDAGSLTVGYLVAVFSILVTYQNVAGGSHATALSLLMPLAIMGVPLFDTLSVVWIRRRAGKPIMLGDRNHFSHRLVAMGFGARGAVATIALLTASTGLLALPLRDLGLGEAFLHVVGLAALFGVVVALEIVGRRP
jgi:UDP-GlcNAc:undecaprenyl-phosphate GlcNAc-1-phosphate transferase